MWHLVRDARHAVGRRPPRVVAVVVVVVVVVEVRPRRPLRRDAAEPRQERVVRAMYLMRDDASVVVGVAARPMIRAVVASSIVAR